MKLISPRLRAHSVKVIVLLSLLVGLQSCRIFLVASRDNDLVTQIDKVTQDVDRFYLQINEVPSAYTEVVQNYIDIEVSLNAIYNKTRLKAKNAETSKIAENVLETWVKYKNEHRQKTILNTGEIKVNHQIMRDFLFALSKAENSKPD